MSKHLEGILNSIGVSSLDKTASIESLIKEELDKRNYQASFTSLRYGKLVLTCKASQARFLRFDIDNILKELNKQYPGAVESISIRT